MYSLPIPARNTVTHSVLLSGLILLQFQQHIQVMRQKESSAVYPCIHYKLGQTALDPSLLPAYLLYLLLFLFYFDPSR